MSASEISRQGFRDVMEGEVVGRCWARDAKLGIPLPEDRIFRSECISQMRSDARWCYVDVPGGKDPRWAK